MALHRALSSQWLRAALRTAERPSATVELPIFLCPTLASRHSSSSLLRKQLSSHLSWKAPCRNLHMPADALTSTSPSTVPIKCPTQPSRSLPAQCTGCGALSQSSSPDQPGYYDLGRKAVQRYLGVETVRASKSSQDHHEEEIFENTVRSLDSAELEKHGVDINDIMPTPAAPEPEVKADNAPVKVPLCDRCHTLLHHQTGVSIYHPTVDSIRDTLAESPYKYNHVYHVLDAADFPMSILPKIHSLLDLMPLRSRNRRSQPGKFFHGQKTEMSFIITRSDLLGPTKSQVDRLVPYLREVLRDALGRSGSDYRLGNVRCVSARRSWWTKELREDIWKRGGAGWLVGKVNVGKSALFEAVFPKGRMDWDPSGHQIKIDMVAKDVEHNLLPSTPATGEEPDTDDSALKAQLVQKGLVEDEYSLLPPAPCETQYPDMPLVSDLPGTTASPIRVPFGNGRGELIDLPGIERTGLEKHVTEEHRRSLIFRSRIVPEQMVLKQGQSLLLGGLIRITPRVPGPIVLSYAFTPIEPHLTSTEKAIAIQEQKSTLNVDSISAPGTGEKIKHAGSFALKWDVTKERAGPITAKDSVGIKVDRLPYRVLAADILIEGVGWVEVVAQVRTKDLYLEPRQKGDSRDHEPEQELSALDRLNAMADGPPKKEQPKPREPIANAARGDQPLNWPMVDVFSPEGKYIGCRKPMNGWLMNKPKITAKTMKSRPRKSMKGAKKMEKMRTRTAAAAASATF
ncbi:hypothetical protein BX600DRAFT_129808 [Xylariales sp. PMI_506]|nr:hypothetical protein BX600DRAFT_129808 [Xylariales sp. PMI_506]